MIRPFAVLAAILCLASFIRAAEPAGAAAPAETRGLQRAVTIPEAIEKKYPEQVVLVTCVDTNGKANIMTAGWTMFCSGNPPMVAVAIGKTRYSHEVIAATRQFVYALPAEGMKDAVMLCGTKSGRDTDKFKEAGLTAKTGLHVKAPLIEECLVNLECTVEHQYDSGSHTIFVGKIVGAWVSDQKPARKRLFNLGRREFKGLP